MKFKNVILLLMDFFESHQVDYALTGAFALKAYGYLRATQDVDFVGRQEDQFKIIQFLESLGFETLYRSTGYSNHCHGLPGLGQIDFVSGEKKPMEMIEIESIWGTIPDDVADQPGQASPPGASDLEPYFDFLDEIEAFHGPKC